MGIYGGIYLNADSAIHRSDKFSYCNFKFADVAILKSRHDTLSIKHSNFNYNNSGMNMNYGFSFWDTAYFNTYIDSSRFIYNNFGIGSWSGISNGKIRFCQFLMNEHLLIGA